MNSEFFDLSADVDVDALMARIRAAAQRRGRSKTQYSANDSVDEGPRIVEAGNLLQEINRSGPFADAINQIPLRAGGWKRRLELRVKRFLKYLVHWNTKAQAELNFSVLRSLGLVAQNLQNIQSNLSLIEKQMREAEQRASTKMDDQLSHLNRELDEMKMRLLRTERSVRRVSDADAALPSIANSNRTSGAARATSLEMDSRATHPASEAPTAGKLREKLFDYFRFEHQFRGSVADIKKRQSTYVELFRGRRNVLDLGCGRGEFVELLSENEINVTGVDSNEDMIEFCRDRGLPVVLGDVFDYLSAVPDRTLDGIAAFQVVEHLSFEQILHLINLCEQKLIPGGIIVTETINTNCPVALADFYLDPTHVRPVPAQMLRYLLGQGAFRVQSLIFTSAIGGNGSETSEVSTFEIPTYVCSYRDYAIVAIKL